MPRDDFDVDGFIDDSMGLTEADGVGDVDSGTEAQPDPAPQQQQAQPQSAPQEERASDFDKSMDDYIRESMGEVKDQQKKDEPKQQQAQPQQQQPGQPQQQGLRPLSGHAHQYVDPDGNIVDANGNMIAAKGMQRRLYQENERIKQDAVNLRGENDRLLGKFQEMQGVVDSMREAGEIFRSAGVSPQEMRDGAQIIATFKANPVAAAREVVARAMALGHNITDIVGDEVGNSVDMQALDRMISQRMGTTGAQPAQGGTQEQPQQNDPIAEQVNTFFARHPEAKQHEADVVFLMQQQNVDMYQAYDMLRGFAAQNNLNLNQPLKPQIEAIAAAAQRAQPQSTGQQSQPTRQQKPLVPGRGSNAQQQQGAQPIVGKSAGADDSWSSILSDTFSDLKRSGMSI